MLTVWRDENKVTGCDHDGGLFKWRHGWPAVSDGFVWYGQRGDRPQSQHLVHKSTEDRKSLSVAVFWITPLQHGTQLLIYFGLHLQEWNTGEGSRLIGLRRGCVCFWGKYWDLPLACVKEKRRSSSARLQLSPSLRWEGPQWPCVREHQSDTGEVEKGVLRICHTNGQSLIVMHSLVLVLHCAACPGRGGGTPWLRCRFSCLETAQMTWTIARVWLVTHFLHNMTFVSLHCQTLYWLRCCRINSSLLSTSLRRRENTGLGNFWWK